MQIKPDKTHFTSAIDTFLNYETVTDSIVISGGMTAGDTLVFSANIDVSESNTLAMVFAENQNTGKKMSLNAGSVHNPFQAVSTEIARHSMNISGGVLSVDVSVSYSTGPNITLTTQTWTITAVLQRVPY